MPSYSANMMQFQNNLMLNQYNLSPAFTVGMDIKKLQELHRKDVRTSLIFFLFLINLVYFVDFYNNLHFTVS